MHDVREPRRSLTYDAFTPASWAASPSFDVPSRTLGFLALLALMGGSPPARELAVRAADPVPDERAPVECVDPFIGSVTSSRVRGSASQGKTFPGACTPHGLVQLSPDSISEGDNGSGYNHEHATLKGFSFTHMSGVGWYGDLGNILVMPTTGPLLTSYGQTEKPGTGYLSRKADEQAEPGFYAVTLSDYRIRAELTATPRAGMLRFTFPESGQSRIQIDLARRIGGTAVMQGVRVVGDRTVEGWARCTADGGGWGNGRGRPDYTVYFHAEFDRPIQTCGVWEVEIPDGARRKHQEADPDFMAAMAAAKVLPGCREREGRHIGFFTEFPTRAGEQVVMKAGISFVSVEGARRNLAGEIPDFDFDAVRQAARRRWSDELSRITVSGGSADQRTAFYTAMYHTLIDPRCFADIDGAYPGGDGRLRRTDEYTRRTIFSGWDVYRSAFPLLTIIAPHVVTDTIRSLTDLAVESKRGYLERWEFLNAYSGCMNGNPAVVMMADAYLKGLHDFDVEKSYAIAKVTCERIGAGTNGFSSGDLAGTGEYDLAEWCLGRMAEALGKQDDARLLLERSGGWRNLYDPDTNWFKGKGLESNTDQQGWFVPHDVPGLIDQVGGREKFLARLEDFFSKTPDVTRWNEFYNHANEPVHLVPFLFNRAGAPWLTQKWVRHICERAYGADVYGLCGDEDVGQMSAWFVLCACGIHQACPGDTRYEIFTPLFDDVRIRIDPAYGNDREFRITCRGNGIGPRFIQAATLDGRPLNRYWLDHAEIVAGGHLELQLRTEPHEDYAQEATVAP